MICIRITVLFLWLLICSNVFFLLPLFHSPTAQQEGIAAHTCWKHTISNPISPTFMPLLSSLFPGQDISLQIKLSVPALFLVITKCAHKPEAALWSVLCDPERGVGMNRITAHCFFCLMKHLQHLSSHSVSALTSLQRNTTASFCFESHLRHNSEGTAMRQTLH